MSVMTLYHGSSEIIRQPVYGKGKAYNDYGTGFYCTEHLELAKEWACTENVDGYANRYELDTSGFSILNLSSGEYTILHCAGVCEQRNLPVSAIPRHAFGQAGRTGCPQKPGSL